MKAGWQDHPGVRAGRQLTNGERAADRLRNGMGSWAFVFIALGFSGPVKAGMIDQSGVDLDKRGNVSATDRDYRTSMDKVFAAGDMRRGQSLVVWAIREGRQAARAIDEALMGATTLPR